MNAARTTGDPADEAHGHAVEDDAVGGGVAGSGATRGGAGVPRGAGRAHVAAASTEDVAAGRRADLAERAGLVGRVVARVTALLAWWQGTRAGRANARFGEAGGGVLTGGIAYAALFSVFAALTIGYTVLMIVLGNRESFRDEVLRTVSESLPGLLATGSTEGLLKPDDLEISASLSIAGVVAVVVLLLSAISVMVALQTAVRAMFGLREAAGNALTGKLRALAGFAGLAVAVLLSTLLTVGLTGAADRLLALLGWSSGAGPVVTVVGLLVAFAVDVATFVLIVRVLSGLHPAWRDLRQGALIAAVGMGVVRALGTSVVAGSVSRNAVLASFAVIVTLLVWINLIARIVLLAAAWTADPPLTVHPSDTQPPAAPAATDPATPHAPPTPTTRPSGSLRP